MAQSSIALTASMRSNLLSLKSIQKQMDTTQERLSTGKKVNSAIDNASSYYQSRALTNRASDLDNLLDSMGQGIQTIQAANEGIEAVTTYVEQLKSIANSAFALDPTTGSYESSMENYKEQFDTIITEMTKLVKDSSYQGINLLTGGDLTVTFNESRTNRFTIEGDDVMAKMNLTSAASWTSAEVDGETKPMLTDEAKTVKQHLNVTQKAGDDTLKVNTGTTEVDNVVKIDGKYYKTDGTEVEAEEGYSITETGKGTDALDANDITALKAVTKDVEVAAGQEVFAIDGEEVIKVDGKFYATDDGAYIDAAGKTVTAKVEPVTSYAESIDDTLDELSLATDYLRSYSAELGNNFSIIETRQDFTEALVDVLETGSDNLVLADMNEESANYLALQTRQQLAVNSLSLASQSAQSVLSLF